VSGERVLVVDDEPQFLRALATSLRAAGYTVETATTGEQALTSVGLGPPDAIILDLVLPDTSGTEVIIDLRGWSEVPVVVVSANGEEAEKIAALDAGADDYVTKPFAIGELLARLRAALRRSGAPASPVIEIGQIRVDLENHDVTVGGRRVHLTPREFDLLGLFAQNEGKLLTHRTILRELWGPAYQTESSYLHVHISQLRGKIEPDPTRPRYLLNEPGAGYRLVDPDAT
jgi:two-component system, OmpR family, KDP operon response regulator KdpE